MRISDWRSDVCSSDLCRNLAGLPRGGKLLALGRVSQDAEPVLSKLSAGILLYRGSRSALDVLLVHPGGPFWRTKDAGAWMIPKGDRKSVVKGKRVSVRVDLGGRRLHKKKNTNP